MTNVNESLRKLPDDALLGPLEERDEVLSELIESFNDRVITNNFTCTLPPKEVTPESTGADLKREIAKLPIEDQLELLRVYHEGNKHLTPQEQEERDSNKFKRKLIDKVINWGTGLITLLVAAFVINGLITGNMDKDVIFKVMDTVSDIVKYIVGSNNS